MKINDNIFENREISWLKFNQRVLSLTDDSSSVPLFQKFKFLQIFCNNLDEFFMVRVGSLFDKKLIDKKQTDPITNMTPQRQLDLIFEKTRSMIKEKDKIYFSLMKKIREYNIQHIKISSLNNQELISLEKFFRHNILPLISPQIIDKHHPFPFLKNKETYVGVRLYCKKKNITKTGIIPASGCFDRIIFLSEKSEKNTNTARADEKLKFILVEDLILHFADRIFNKYNIMSKTAFRITRNCDLDVDEDLVTSHDNIKKIMEELLKKRRKLIPVKLDIVDLTHNTLLASYLCKKLKLSSWQIFDSSSPLDLSFVSNLESMIDKDKYPILFYPKFTPKISSNIDLSVPMINQIQRNDILLSYPFESMIPFLSLLNQAAEDSTVTSIKITLYRVANNSQIIFPLKKAAENGKEVLVVVELKARFDEQNNIDWATSLEESGCKVIYGVEGYKVHCKILLITRKVNSQIEYITQIGTGNYNEITAKQYTDLCLMTCNELIAQDAIQIFNSLCTGALLEESKVLLVSPNILKPKILEYISEEISIANSGKPAKIIIKCNSISDKEIILKLVEASCAGVEIHLIIRGICCVLPNIKDRTENITVKSIVGRFLEHSRIFSFGVGRRTKIYIGSADLMSRNTMRRVELACPIMDHNVKRYISTMLDIYVKDNVSSTTLNSDGDYIKVIPHQDENIYDSQFCS